MDVNAGNPPKVQTDFQRKCLRTILGIMVTEFIIKAGIYLTKESLHTVFREGKFMGLNNTEDGQRMAQDKQRWQNTDGAGRIQIHT